MLMGRAELEGWPGFIIIAADQDIDRRTAFRRFVTDLKGAKSWALKESPHGQKTLFR